MYRLYEYPGSGNCYKIALLLGLLGKDYESIRVDIMAGESRDPDFLAKNANGKVPLLEIKPGEYLPESNAALFYLAEGTPYFPESRLARARVMQWMFFEQYSHEPNIAVARFLIRFLGNPDDQKDRVARCQQQGRIALDVMEVHLERHEFFADEKYTIADIALYAYTHVADEGGFDLSPYPAIQKWLTRVAAQPGHKHMMS
ncbi:MAG: glutathione S-transferase family protein [Gammaproteobacteria bacterium]